MGGWKCLLQGLGWAETSAGRSQPGGSVAGCSVLEATSEVWGSPGEALSHGIGEEGRHRKQAHPWLARHTSHRSLGPQPLTSRSGEEEAPEHL